MGENLQVELLFHKYGSAVVEIVAIERDTYVIVRKNLCAQVTTPSLRYKFRKRRVVMIANKIPVKNTLAILSSTSFTFVNLKNRVIVTGVIKDTRHLKVLTVNTSPKSVISIQTNILTLILSMYLGMSCGRADGQRLSYLLALASFP